MKLYTEEQVKKAIQLADKLHYLLESQEEGIISELTPIELPSDEEIETAALDTYREHPNNPKEHPEWTYNKDVNAPRKRRAFNIGAKWVIEKLKQQDKQMIDRAHHAITRIKGKDYAPNVHEIQEWIDKQQENGK